MKFRLEVHLHSGATGVVDGSTLDDVANAVAFLQRWVSAPTSQRTVTLGPDADFTCRYDEIALLQLQAEA